jgi:hypothetical protein
MICKSNNFAGVNNANVNWQNWSERVNFHADQMYEPYGGGAALENLVWVVANATGQGKGLHAIGSGWGFADLAATDSWTVKIDDFQGVLTYVVGQIGTPLVPATVGAGLTDDWRQKQNNPVANTQLVHIEAGMEVGDLIDLLANLNLALPVLGGANGQSVAGAFTTSTHGGDWDQPPLVDCVRAIHLVTHGGQELWMERASEPVTTDARLAPVLPCAGAQIVRSDDIFDAALVSAGRFGVFYSLVLEVRRAFRVVEVTTRPSRNAVLQALGAGMSSQDLFQPLFNLLAQIQPPVTLSEFNAIRLATTTPYFFQLIFNSLDPDDLWVQRRWITPDVNDLNLGGSTPAALVFLASAALAAVSWIGGPGAVAPLIHKVLDSAMSPSTLEGKRGSHAVVTSGSRAASHNFTYKADSIEVMFPATNSAYIDFLNTIMASCQNYHQAGYISVRPSRAGRATLSMHNVASQHAMSIEIASIKNPANANDLWMSFVHQAAVDRGGRPHWGQINTLDDTQMTFLYGQARRNWQVALDRVSGNSNVFSNSFTRQRGLEPVGASRKVSAVSPIADELLVIRLDNASPEGAAVQFTRWTPTSGGWTGWKALPNGKGSAETFFGSCAVGDRAYYFWVGPDGWVYFVSRGADLSWANLSVVGRSNEPEFQGVPCGALHAVSCQPATVHSFYSNRNGVIIASRGDTAAGTVWPETTVVRGGRTAPGGQVTGVSRRTGQVDVFTVGVDGQVYTAAWNAAQGWQGWWPIPGVQAKPGAYVGSTSRRQDQLDIFVVDVAGKVMSAAWNPSQAGWHGWWHIQSGVTNSAFVTAVSRSLDKLDIFTTDNNRQILTAAWDPPHGWGGWWPVNAAKAQSIVWPVSRSADKLDLFFIDPSGTAQTAAWQPGGGWGGPWLLS